MDLNSKKLIVVTGPFGAGIKDIVASLFQERDDLTTVTPVTSRKMKEGEMDGVSFYFYDLDGWNAMKESGDLLEATELAGNDYGTSRRLVSQALAGGKHVLLTLEPERAEQVKRNMPNAVCVYLEPADPATLWARYAVQARNAFELTARMELAEAQRTRSAFCDERIDSTDLSAALSSLNRLIDRL